MLASTTHLRQVPDMRKLPALLFLTFVFAAPAHAYLDPGSGSMLVQVLVAGVAGAAFILRLYWQKFLGLFKRSKNAKAPKK
jgi:hypothetical protein